MAPRTIFDLNPLSFPKYRAARALRTRNTKIAFFGDSTFAGNATGGDTTQVVKSIPMQVAAKLQARGIPAGANNRFGCGSSLFSTLGPFDGRVTSTGTVSQSSTPSLGGNGIALTTTGSITFTPQANVTKFDIYWRDGAVGRNFSWAIDGGATTEIDSTGPINIVKTTVSAGTAGIHALTLAWVSGSVNIFGIDAYDDTGSRRELSIWNCGITGATSTNLADNSDASTGRLAQIIAAQPDLSIIQPGLINNWRNSLTLAQTGTDVTALVNTCKLSGDVILYTPRFDNASTGLAAQQEDFVSLLRGLALSLGCSLLDSRAVFMGSFANFNAMGFNSDTVHGDTGGAGYGDEAEHIVHALMTI